MPDEARATLDGFSTENEQFAAIDINLNPVVRQDLARAAIRLMEGDPATALVVLGDVQTHNAAARLPGVRTRRSTVLRWPRAPGAGRSERRRGRNRGRARRCRTRSADLPVRDVQFGRSTRHPPSHQTAHRALLADAVDLLEPPGTAMERARLPQTEQLSPSELRVLRYLPTNLTRPEIARSLHVSVNTVNTHIRSIYSKLGAPIAVRRFAEHASCDCLPWGGPQPRRSEFRFSPEQIIRFR